MSGRVVGEVKDHSRAKGTTLNVLYALAEAAHHDGITWLPIEPPTNKPNGRCITRTVDGLVRCTPRSAMRAIKKLEQLGEIEVRKVQRGQRRINVYRVIVGRVDQVEIDYERLPFELDRPFGRPDKLSGRNRAGESADEVTSVVETTGQNVTPRPDILTPRDLTSVAPRARKRELEPSVEPSPEPSVEPSAAADQEGPSVAQVLENDRDREPAAAAAEQKLVAEVEALPGFDRQSWRALSRVTAQLELEDVDEALQTLKQRRQVANPMGLLTTLLRVRLEERARLAAVQAQAELQRLAERSRAQKIAELLDYGQICKLSSEERCEFLEAELDAAAARGELVTAAEREQLRAIAKDDDRESPLASLERWIRDQSPALEQEHVRQEIDGFCDEQGLDHIERGALQELAEDAREAGSASDAAEAAA